MVEKAEAIASHLLEAAAADLVFADGRFTVTGTDRAVTMAEVIAASVDDAQVPQDLLHSLDVALENDVERLSYPNGCHVAEVEVDPETGAVEIVDYAVVHDLGNILHRAVVDGQVTGATTQGIGQALCEGIVFELCEGIVFDRDSGQLLSGSLMDYTLPRAAQLPNFRTGYFEDAPCVNNPLGVKGVGEAGCGGAPPAIVSAVVDALAEFGVSHIDMPLGPERVWRAIQDARGPGGD
jgi:carbon-monoxide dehydrogenase large subunit